MLTLDPLTPSASPQSRLETALQGGQAVQARVIAMLKENLARLAILGETIDVPVSTALDTGTPVTVEMNRDGSLKLAVPTEAQAAQPQAAKGDSQPHSAGAIGAGILAARAAIEEALLGIDTMESPAGSGATGASPKGVDIKPSSQASTQEAGQPAHAQLQAEVRSRYGVDVVSYQGGTAAGPARPMSFSSGSDSATKLPLQPAVFSASPSQESSPSGLIVPFQLPQMAQPLLIRVEQQDEDGKSESGYSPAVKRWTASVSVDAGAFGRVHVSVSLRASLVSVRLSADQAQSAYHLSAWLPELKTSLERTGFLVDELSAREAPVADAPSTYML